MISISASGFIAEKPELQLVGSKKTKKCEFTVVDQRRAWTDGEWKTVWERVTFVAWGEEAEKVASILDKGFNVFCTGLQETHKWLDSEQRQRQVVKYALTAWSIERRGLQPDAREGAAPAQGQPSRRAQAPLPPRRQDQGFGNGESHHVEGDRQHSPQPPQGASGSAKYLPM